MGYPVLVYHRKIPIEIGMGENPMDVGCWKQPTGGISPMGVTIASRSDPGGHLPVLRGHGLSLRTCGHDQRLDDMAAFYGDTIV